MKTFARINRIISFELAAAAAVAVMALQPSPGFAQGSAFAYQGALNDGASPASGSYDLRFALCDAATNGSVIAGPLTNSATAVSNGLFSVTLDFGAAAFDGGARWLDIAVRTNGGADFTPLAPRQAVTAAPYAILAGAASNVLGVVSASQLSGSIPATNISGALAVSQLPAAVLTNGASGVSISGAFSGNGSGLTSVPASSLTWTTNFSVIGWGDNSSGQTTIPAGLTNALAVAAGWSHSLALKSDGAVVAWGDNSIGQTTIPAGLTNVTAIAAGEAYSLALKSDGTVIGWGYNGNGQITIPSRLTNVIALAPGSTANFSLVIFKAVTEPVVSVNGVISANGAGLTDVNAANLTGAVPLALLPASVVTNNESGVTLDGAFTGDGAGITNLTAAILTGVLPLANLHQAVVTNNQANVTLSGAFTNSAFYGDGGGLTNLSASALNGTVSLAQLPTAVVTNKQTNITLNGAFSGNGAGLTNVNAANLTGTVALALLPAGIVTNGASGVSISGSFSGDGSGLASVPLSAWASTNISLVAWGANSDGETTIPSGLTNVTAFAAGMLHSLALKSDGTVVAWGYNEDGETTLPLGLANVAVLACGSASSHSLAICHSVIMPVTSTNGVISGTVAASNLPDNTAFLDANQTFSGSNTFTQTVILSNSAPMLRIIGPGGSGATATLDLSSYDTGSNAPAARIQARDNSWSSDLDFYTKTPGSYTNALVSRMHISAGGYIGISNSSPAYLLSVASAYCNGTTWVNGSDRDTKEGFSEIDPQTVLFKVLALPITEWSYKAEAQTTRHIGPMAQDFHAAFGLNGDDDKHISTVDENGVALAAIQGLNQKTDLENAALREQIAALKLQNQSLEQRLEKLEQLIKAANGDNQ